MSTKRAAHRSDPLTEASRPSMQREGMMLTAEARANLSEVLGRVAYGGQRVLIGKRGKPMAALVSIEDLEALRALEDAMDLAEARKARREGGKNLTHAEVGERLGLR